MSQVFDTSQWLNFFMKAGLPPNVAANYALIFSDNRIQSDMLMDLSKEYLYDMGIRVMGDVIAILRYAKEFHTQMAKERAIGATTSSPTKVVGRLVGHYTRTRLSPKPSPVRQVPPGPQVSRYSQAVPKPNIISLKRSASTEPLAAKKIRRVPPEEEGAYKIKMPAGTTERTRQILQKQQVMQGSKRSVFARLGDSAVSSSTDLTKPKASSSVFERLGPSSKNTADDTPTSTVLINTKKTVIKGKPLQYQGVLKITSGNRRVVSTGIKANRTVIKPLSQRLNTVKKISLKPPAKVNSLQHINTILQSNTDGSRGVFGRTRSQSEVTVKDRLGIKVGPRKIQPFTKTKISSGIQERLGMGKLSNVFDRLGK